MTTKVREQVTCWCTAYDFPHRHGGGKCDADPDAKCPSCGAIVGDEVLGYHLLPSADYYQPPEWEVTIHDCPCCHATGTY